MRRTHRALAPHAFSVIMAIALFFTLAAKCYHAFRCSVMHEYVGWILPDLCVLLGLEAVLAMCCYRWRKRWVFRTATIVAAITCTWSVINAAWIIRTGVQILPVEVLPLFRDPLNHLDVIGINLLKMPLAATALLGPSMVALTFFFAVLAKPTQPAYTNRTLFKARVIAVAIFITMAIPSGASLAQRYRSSQVATSGFHYNAQLKALTSMVMPDASPISREDLLTAKRVFPTEDQVFLPENHKIKRLNVVFVILESIQYAQTSFAGPDRNPTPFLKSLAEQGVVFTQMRSTLTHTSKAIFSLMSGRYPCASQDVMEAVPTDQPYASLATILERHGNYRTAYFQSAKGTFESRPSLIKNLGFDEFWSREDMNDPNVHLGYLAADEFATIEPLANWIAEDTSTPFCATLLLSAAHDPYEVPTWYGEPAKEPLDRYKQVVTYTDSFLKALDDKLQTLGLKDNTVLCIVGDHAEGFGEHGKRGHERIGFDEVLRIVWTMRSPQGITPGTQIHDPVSSIDVLPTLLSVLGYDCESAHFDGLNALETLGPRRVFFSGWVPEGPAGYVKDGIKYVHTPSLDEVTIFDLVQDPLEINGLMATPEQAQAVQEEVIAWRKSTLVHISTEARGNTVVFNNWLCRWTGRDPIAKSLTPAP
ncbi:MAG: sulfatase-like hydrolase/transferase [Phycisphaerae bacterium]|nr:sulfatase-like hydrolase/transferase [Phycisphaerae bacterium]